MSQDARSAAIPLTGDGRTVPFAVRSGHEQATRTLRTTRDLMIRRLHGLVVEVHRPPRTNGEGFYWKHGHVEAQWLGDALAAAGEIALRAADYSEKWAAGSLA